MAERENRGRGRNREEQAPEFADRLVAINRVSKTVKGGKRFGFAAWALVKVRRSKFLRRPAKLQSKPSVR